jgi:hypothetical protein
LDSLLPCHSAYPVQISCSTFENSYSKFFAGKILVPEFIGRCRVGRPATTGCQAEDCKEDGCFSHIHCSSML